MIAWFVAVALAAPLDLNAADAASIAALPGIGLIKATNIVAWRERYGPFLRWEDLDDVPGIGAPSLVALKPFARVVPPIAKPSGSTPTVPVFPVPVATLTLKFDPNSASEAELAEIPGIGATRAKAIVEDRQVHGDFSSCTDLERVPGVGPATVATIAERCVLP